MCGIIAVIRRPSTATEPDPVALDASLQRASAMIEAVASAVEHGASPEVPVVEEVAATVAAADVALRSAPAVTTLIARPDDAEAVAATAEAMAASLDRIDRVLDRGVVGDADDASIETVNAALIRVKDAVWAIRKDRLRAAHEVAALARPGVSPAGLGALFGLHQALSALDRLEVRGRDSAGIELVVTGHGLDDDPASRTEIERRAGDANFVSGSVRRQDATLVFVYKAAFEIGELGDNTAALRAAIRDDDLLHRALRSDTVEAQVLGHTRWASIGIISEPNAHPQSSDETAPTITPLCTAVLNGDVDNHADLVASHGLSIAPAITTDAKVIPALVSRRLDAATTLDAFREAVAQMEGSVAIALSNAAEPGALYLALRGSGQALYVGLADDAFIVASEPYGVVEETTSYLRMDGETPSDPANPTASRGQIVRLDAEAAGTIEGVRRWSYDGTEQPVSVDELSVAEITTRDIDRGAFPHYLLKEITDAPGSFRKTLRGKLTEVDGLLTVELGTSTLPEQVRRGLADGSITSVLTIGQGTAAAASESFATMLAELTADTALRVDAVLATELSGFGLRRDMSDTLVVAVSQSGTTTDTNRTVDLVRGRGATVIAIVNRRNSDLCDKSDGVLYTSDGRDVEMSVASTKAFYAQIAAGLLLAFSIADLVPGASHSSEAPRQELLRSLRELPEAMSETLTRRSAIAEAAHRYAPPRRYWAIVGNGPNRIAAREVRIKLSELCYKSIGTDATEDKKHIDLSAEPMILVCAAGLVGSTASDVGKEVAIYRAHKAAPVVIATDGEHTFDAGLAVLAVPHTHQRLAFVLSAMVGHLFGYEAALAIDAQARPLRESRSVIEHLVTDHAAELRSGTAAVQLLEGTARDLAPFAQQFFEGLRSGSYNGHLEASTAIRLAALFRYAAGSMPLDGYQLEFGKVGTPGVVLDDLTAALTAGIEELTRPVDAIKHQAKTVTVGISRSDESLLQVGLVAAVLSAGAGRDRLSYSTLRSLAALDPAVEAVRGFTRYRVDGVSGEQPTATVIDRGGIAASIPSRTEADPRLRGTKHLVARERELMVARGRGDGRTVLIVPETKDGETTGLTLLHLALHDRVAPTVARSVLSGYRRRYQALRDAVTETEDALREELFADQPTIDLLCEPILELADRWRA
ncbi:MAG: SIS domain-containing protein [Microthrixaceae bacterium]